MSNQTKKALRYHWIAGGIASSLSRFIPVPLIDGFVDERAKRYSLDRTFDYHDRLFQASDVDALYKDSEGAREWIASKVKQLALYPVRKVAKIVTASTGVPKDFARTYLLARTVDLCLAHELLLNEDSPKVRYREARKIREAFDAAFDQLDDILFKTTTRVVRREFATMGPEVSAALARIIGRPLKAKGVSTNSKKTSSANPEEDAAFSKLIEKFDDCFRKEMAERDLGWT